MVVKHSDIPVFVAHSLYPPHLRQLVEDAVEAFDNTRGLVTLRRRGLRYSQGVPGTPARLYFA